MSLRSEQSLFRLVVVTVVVGGALAGQDTAAWRQRIADLAKLEPAARLTALTGVADELLFADATVRAVVVEDLRALAAKGLFCSPAPDQPSLLWFQFHRAMRRHDVATAGADHAALGRQLDEMRDKRSQIHGMVRVLGQQGGRSDLHDLTSFGWHGAGEVLEAIGDLAERLGPDAKEAGAELARYLVCEKPHPSTNHQEGNANVGEPAPADVPAAAFPVLWNDGYRFALARAVLTTKQPDTERAHAVLHLLYSPRRADRLDAMARLRIAPLGEDAVTHLIAQLRDSDRLVVREAISVLGTGGPAAEAARGALQELANGEDRELRAVATRALQLLDRR